MPDGRNPGQGEFGWAGNSIQADFNSARKDHPEPLGQIPAGLKLRRTDLGEQALKIEAICRVPDPAPISVVIAATVRSLAKVQVPAAKKALVAALAEFRKDLPAALFHSSVMREASGLGASFVLRVVAGSLASTGGCVMELVINYLVNQINRRDRVRVARPAQCCRPRKSPRMEPPLYSSGFKRNSSVRGSIYCSYFPNVLGLTWNTQSSFLIKL